MLIFVVFADVFSLSIFCLYLLYLFKQISRSVPAVICSREESKNCQNSPAVEKSKDTGESLSASSMGDKEGGRTGRGNSLPSSGPWGPAPSSVNHLEADAGPLGRWMGKL